jgi:general secretion pathway protein E
VIGVLAQRLVRTLCPACKQPDEAMSRPRPGRRWSSLEAHRRRRPYKPVGCLECRMTGFRGRVGLYELLA